MRALRDSVWLKGSLMAGRLPPGYGNVNCRRGKKSAAREGGAHWSVDLRAASGPPAPNGVVNLEADRFQAAFGQGQDGNGRQGRQAGYDVASRVWLESASGREGGCAEAGHGYGRERAEPKGKAHRH